MTGWAVQTLVASTLLMALVLLIRRPFADKFGAGAAYALWLAPLARILTPPLPAESALAAVTIRILAVPSDAAAAPADPTGAGAGGWLFALWLGGAACFLAWHMLAYRRFLLRVLESGRRLEQPSALGPELIESAAVRCPTAAGIVRQRILLPAGLANRLGPEQMRLAIAHERLHHRRGDLLALSLSLAVLALHWFNPIAYVAHRAFRRDLEAACDAQLVARLDAAQRRSYARAILGCTAASMPAAICALTPIDDLKRRLSMLNNDHSKPIRSLGLTLAVSLAAAGLTLGSGASAAAGQDQAEPTRKTVQKFVMRGGEGEHPRLMRMEKCEGEKIEASADASSGEDKKKVFIALCGKKGATDAELAAMAEKAAAEFEKSDEIDGKNKAEVIAQLRAKAAELRSRR